MKEEFKVGDKVVVGTKRKMSSWTSVSGMRKGAKSVILNKDRLDGEDVYAIATPSKMNSSDFDPEMDYEIVYPDELEESKQMRERVAVKVTFDNGDSLITEINTDLKGAKDYYLGKKFNLGAGAYDVMTKAVKVELIESKLEEATKIDIVSKSYEILGDIRKIAIVIDKKVDSRDMVQEIMDVWNKWGEVAKDISSISEASQLMFERKQGNKK